MNKNSSKKAKEKDPNEITPSSILKYYMELDEQDVAIKQALRMADLYDHRHKESWEYISYHNLPELARLLEFLRKSYCGHSPTICDVGAGTGRMVRLFRDFGYKAFGVEFHPPYVQHGRKVFDLSPDELILADAFKVPDEIYRTANVIYTYMPIRDQKLMSELHLHLYNVAKPGTILVEMYPVYYPTTAFDDSSNPWPGEKFVTITRKWRRGD